MGKNLEITEKLEKYIEECSHNLHPVQKEIITYNQSLGDIKKMQIALSQCHFLELLIKISKTTQVPIIPIGFASSKFKKLKSWDSFLVTQPFSKCAFVWGESMSIPKNCTDYEIEELRNKLEHNINKCIDLAKKEINA